jgi:Fur family peroxide stress response transcriptional regulator
MTAYEKLLAHGIHPSIQRIAIMDYLDKHHTHPTVEDVYNALCRTIPTLSRTTVYNTLRLFSDQKAALMLTIDEKKSCFDGNTAPHAHFLCKKCGHVYDLPIEESENIQMQLDGFDVDEVHLYYKGTCKKCRAKEGAQS